MNKANRLVLIVFLFLTACANGSGSKLNREEVLKKGEELFTKYGCAVCHSLDGKIIYGPPLNGIFMKNVKVLRNGKEIDLVADRDYLKKAITNPRFEKVSEYQNKEMPLPVFSEEDAEILVEYLIALDPSNQTGK